LNALFDSIAAGFENTLSLDGTTPNSMGADIDLNSNDLLNVNSILAQYFKDSSGNLVSLADVNTLGAIVADLELLADIQDGTIATNAITTVAANSANVTTVAGISSNVTTVAGINADVTTVAGISGDVSTVATNVADVTNFADVYQGGKAIAPTLRNDGSSLQIGDLYFNTVTTQLAVYTGTTWTSGVAGDVSIQNFNGDNSTTAFTLAASPTSEDNLQVYINGVYQNKNTFSLSGVTLSFSEAPPLGTSNIEVVAIETLALGEGAASLTTYLPSGTGAVQTTVQEKLRESVSVLDFGAVGDGVVDDTAAFAAALVLGKAVYAPAGTYKATFTIPYGGILYGDGPAHTIITPTAGSTHAIMLDGTIVGGTQFCTVENLSIRNPNAVASCSGLKLYGVDVLDVNDNHTFSNLYINGFDYGIEILGRCIVSTFRDITTDTSNTGLYVASDAANYAFNANTFTNCRFINGQGYGVYISGYAGLGLTFTGCDFEQNNLNNVVGGAGIEIENAETVTFQGCYWEANGAGIPVDAIFPANNGVDLILSGLRSYENHIDGSWFAQSTTSILVTSTAAIYGGSVAGNRFQNRAGGWAVAVSGRYPDNDQPVFEIKANNILGGKIQITENVDEKNPAYLGQSDSCIFSAAATSLNLVTHKNVVFNDASPFTISTLENAYPGMELWIYNAGAGEITIAAGLAHDAAAISITAGESFSFVVSTYPLRGKLIPKTIRKEGTWTPLQGSGLTLVGAYGSSGTYIRDGSKVTVIGLISGATSVAIGGSGEMCTGLPFAAGSFGVGSTINNTLNASGACQAAGSTLIASTFGASAVIYFSCTYFV
jgi:hypothetical protein